MDYSIKDLPESERPREKLAEKGVKSLTETELVSLIIRSGISGKNVKELSGEILNSYSLAELSDVSMEELERIRGVSSVKAGQLKAASELSKRLQKEKKARISSFSDVKAAVADMRYESTEKMRLILLKSSNEVIDTCEIEGDVDSVDFKVKDVLKKVIERNASGFIMCHNHPSGQSKPTEADLKATEELTEAARMVGIKLLDHAIVGEEVESMRELTDLDFG